MTSLSFYAGIHDHIEHIIKNEQNDQCVHPYFSSPTWDLIRARSKDVSDSGNATSCSTIHVVMHKVQQTLEICVRVKLQEENEQLLHSLESYHKRPGYSTVVALAGTTQ